LRKSVAEAAVQERLSAIERDRKESEGALQARIEEIEAAKTKAEQNGVTLQDQLDALRLTNEAAIKKIKEDAAARETSVRAEAITAAEASMQEKISTAEQLKTEAEGKVAAAEEMVRTLQESQAGDLEARLREQRDALEAAKTDAVNEVKSAAFEEKMKLSARVDELQRAFDKKTAEELGEGAEINLYEDLKAAFPTDRIERVNKGQAGADILHVVINNGNECGTIIYDSKNHNQWRYEFVSKLASDQMAAKAAHSVLSTRKFPAGSRHLHVHDGVIIASPARVVAVVSLLRQNLLQIHTLTLSNEARTQKTAELYSFITSKRFNDLLARIETHTDDLLELQVKDQKAHGVMWRRQGELLSSIHKTRADLCNEIEMIIGTAQAPEEAP
jgi:hypothetical protein